MVDEEIAQPAVTHNPGGFRDLILPRNILAVVWSYLNNMIAVTIVLAVLTLLVSVDDSRAG